MSIVYQVWEAIEEDKRMPTDTIISLQTLSKEDDGIFPSERSWNSFLTSNFGIYLTGEPRKGLLKKYCYELKQYKHLFVVHIGGGKYMAVAPEDLEFTFEYDANNYKRGANMPTMVEIFVMAHIKE
mgnify:CR=1 FL=1